MYININKCKIYIYIYNIYNDKNLQNIAGNRKHRKKANKPYSDVVKPVVSSIEKALESDKTVFDLKNIQSILLRDENFNSSKIKTLLQTFVMIVLIQALLPQMFH